MKSKSPVLLGCLLLIAGLSSSRLAARDLLAHNQSELKSALRNAQPGDIITLKNGVWKDTSLAVSHGGAADHPVEIRAETPGEVKLNGSSLLEINAPYVRVDGLLFVDGAIKAGAVIQFNSHHGVVQNTAIIDYNPAAFETGYYWVFFNGDNNVIDRCYFKGKSNLEPLIGNALDGSRHNGVVRSYFKNIPYHQGNGREDIRVWGSGKMEVRENDGAYFLIQRNLFDHADGEGVEIISLKSNFNQVLQNTIIATKGCLNIRRGDHNRVAGNIILGQGLPGAEGLRMSGQHNVVQGNYVSHCGYGIKISAGEFTGDDLTGRYKPDVKAEHGVKLKKQHAQLIIPTYPQVRDLTLTGNILVANTEADLEMGSDYKKHWPESQQVLLPENCLIQRNRFVRPQGGASVVVTTPDNSAPLDRFKFQPNHYADNILLGGKNTFAPAASGFTTAGIPAGWTEAAEMRDLQPLRPGDVGPAWIIALRKAGNFALEEPASAFAEPLSSPHKNKKTKNN